MIFKVEVSDIVKGISPNLILTQLLWYNSTGHQLYMSDIWRTTLNYDHNIILWYIYLISVSILMPKLHKTYQITHKQ